MPTLANYKGLQVVSPDPTGAGGLAIQNDLKKLVDWQAAVLDKDLNTPPGSPSDGDRYIVGTSPTGAWATHANELAEWSNDASAWLFLAPQIGWPVYVTDDQILYFWNSTAWTKLVSGPAGSSTQVQFNDSGDLAGSASLTYDKTATALQVDNLKLDGNTLSATNTNGPLILSPNGNGAIQVDAGGNTRGKLALDLQSERSDPSQVASGNYSEARGENCIASGIYSIASGYGANATEYSANARGGGSVASGWNARALGDGTTASGNYAIANGFFATASGDYANANGWGSLANGENATANGYDASASAKSAIANGDGAIASDINAIANGEGATASGRFCYANGMYATASGAYSIASDNLATSNATHSSASGYSSTASGSYAVACGFEANAQANYAVARGRVANAEGVYATASGEYAEAVGDYSVATGAYASASLYGQHTQSAGVFDNISGNAQTSQFVLRNSTTNATATELFLDGSYARLLVPQDTAWDCAIHIVAVQQGMANAMRFDRSCLIVNDGGTTSLVGTVDTIGSDKGSAGWSVSITDDDTSDSLKIYVAGAASTNIRWVARVVAVEVAYP